MRNRVRSYVVGVTGGSGSGKTTLCRELVARLGTQRCVLMSQDDYYRDQSHVPEDARQHLNFDDPAVVDAPLLANQLRTLRDGGSVNVPVYDFCTHTRTGKTQTVAPAEIVFVEGILLFCLPGIAGLCDFKVYVDTPEPERNERRVLRDVRERGRTMDSVISQINEQVLPMHRLHVEPQKPQADLVVSGCAALEETVERLSELIERGRKAI